MSKRTATTELNHDNWNNEDDEPETAGVFKKATSDQLKNREFRTARRRGVASEDSANTTKSVFAGFSGFKKTEPVSSKAVFSFLSAAPNGSSPKSDSTSTLAATKSASLDAEGGDEKSINGVDAESDATARSSDKDKEYYRKLKGLNESVSKWISTHVASNPLVILTPVFQDYEKHLATIQSRDDGKLTEGLQMPEKKNHTSSKEASLTGSNESAPKAVADEKKPSTGSLFGSSSNSTATATYSFGSASSGTSSQFCFGSPSSSNATVSAPTFSFGSGNTTSPSAGFSFGTGKPFTFSNVANTNTSEEKKDDDDEADEDTPPKPDHKPVNEDGATYTKRCKVFIKQGKEYSDRGIGNLFLKPVDGGKTQLIVRADTSLGNVLLNFLVGASLPVQRIGANNVAVVCIPTPESQPPPVTVLLRVKTSDDADELFNTLEKHKKEAA